MTSLKARLKEARADRGISQAGLAKALGLGQATIASIENGRNQSSGHLVQIAEYLGVSPTWLAEGTGPKRGQPAAWPFSAPFEAYQQLPESRKQALNTIVSAFLSAGAEEADLAKGQPQSRRTKQTDTLERKLDDLLPESSADDEQGRQRRRSK